MSAPAPRPLPGLADLPMGRPPRIGYVVGSTYVDGRERVEIDLPGHASVGSVLAFRGGLLVGDDRSFEGTSGLYLVIDGRVTHLGRGFLGTSGTGAVSRDGRSLAWATFGVPETGVDAPALLHRRTGASVVTRRLVVDSGPNPMMSVTGFLDGDVLYQRNFIGGVYRSDLGSPAKRVRALTSVSSIDERGGLLVGPADPSGRRTTVLDSRSGERLWSSRATLRAFDPSGRLLVGGGRARVLLDARTGAPTAELGVSATVRLTGLAWEDPRHLLAVATQGRRQAIVRFDLAGRAELATPSVRTQVRATSYLLEHQA